MLTSGTRLGIYEIVSPLGAGGMGEVYRAHDARLKRDVALKILPESFASDPERLARFQREAEVLASLNHPNIAAIYGFEERALVLELVEGETLADRIARGAIPIDEALPIARQIAEALEAAHECGIIHRDLKPANIKVRPDGTVKVLDFGLAKLAQASGSGPQALDVTASPTITSPAMMTGAGMILGTAAYMSPEQAKGREADKRSDIWAFGAVLFEILTGTRAFAGDDVTEVLASVIRSEPDWNALPAVTPAAISRLLRRCLQKDRTRRVADIADARLEIDEAMTAPAGGADLPAVAPLTPRRRRAILMGAAAAALALAAGLLIGGSQQPAALAGNVALLEASMPAELALAREPYYPVMSPDGRFVAFSGQKNGVRSLYVRTMTDGSIRDFASVVTGNRFFWMPDSRWIVFVAEGSFWRAQVDDRQRVRLGPGPPGNFGGGAANAAGVLIFASSEGIYRVTENEAPPLILKARDDDGAYAAPTFLPDGNRFLFTIREGPRAGVVMGRLESDAMTSIVPGLTVDVHYAAGYIVYALEGQVVARSLDLEATPPVVGDPSVVVTEGAGARAHSDAAGTGLSFSYGPYNMRQLMSLDRTGRMLSRVGTPLQFRELDISADGRRIAANLGVAGEGSSRLAVVDVETGAASPVTALVSTIGNPRWGRDTRRVFFNANTNGVYATYARDVATGETTLVRPFNRTNQFLDDVSPDGSMLLYHEATDVWAAPTSTSGTPVRIVHVLSGNLDQPSYSPDMRFVAFNTTETGRSEVNVVPAQPDGQRWQISRTGGAQPLWSADGSELFYLALDGTLMTVAVPRGATDWSAAIPRPLFATNVDLVDPGQEQYVVSPRGDRFFVTVPIENARRHAFGVLLGWRSLLQTN